MAVATTSEGRELPDDLPFHVGDIIGAGAFATYGHLPAATNFPEYELLKTKIAHNSTQ